VDRNRPGFAIRTLPTELIEGYLDQAIRVVGRVRGITPSRVGKVRISVSRVRGITGAPVHKVTRAAATDAAESRRSCGHSCWIPPLPSAAVCPVAASMAAIDLLLIYRVIHAWPTRIGLGHHRDNFVILITRFSRHASGEAAVGGLRQPTTAATRPSGFRLIIFRVALPHQPSNPIRNQPSRPPLARLASLPRRANPTLGTPEPFTRPSRRIAIASLPYPLMTVLP
jgi:hypothetical protein